MLQFKDRLIFDTIQLKNGITVHMYPYDVPFAESVIYFPYGHMHNIDRIIPGTFHFLEHMVFRRSDAFPELFAMRKKVQLKGAHFNANTGNVSTQYELDSPAGNFMSDFSDLVDHLTSIQFQEDDFEKERGVIRNERTKYEKYFPGSNEINKYFLTRWWKRETSSLDEQLGLDSSLNKMSTDYLKEVYSTYYWTKDTIVLIGGKFNKDAIIQKLETVQTKEVPKHSKKPEKIEWINQNYKEVTFDTAKRPEYVFGLIIPSGSPQDSTTLNFIGNLATNSSDGVIFNWLRHDLNESYSVSSSVRRYDSAICFDISIPLNTQKYVGLIRKEILSKIRQALSDPKIVNENIDRLDAKDAFSYQRIGDIIGTALIGIKSEGRIVSESEYNARWDKCRDTAYLLEFFDRYFIPENIGEALVLPKKYNRFEDALVKFAKKYILRIQ